jgi:hypothetical protein
MGGSIRRRTALPAATESKEARRNTASLTNKPFFIKKQYYSIWFNFKASGGDGESAGKMYIGSVCVCTRTDGSDKMCWYFFKKWPPV